MQGSRPHPIKTAQKKPSKKSRDQISDEPLRLEGIKLGVIHRDGQGGTEIRQSAEEGKEPGEGFLPWG